MGVRARRRSRPQRTEVFADSGGGVAVVRRRRWQTHSIIENFTGLSARISRKPAFVFGINNSEWPPSRARARKSARRKRSRNVASHSRFPPSCLRHAFSKASLSGGFYYSIFVAFFRGGIPFLFIFYPFVNISIGMSCEGNEDHNRVTRRRMPTAASPITA